MQNRDSELVELIQSDKFDEALKRIEAGGVDPNATNHKQQGALQLAASRGAIVLVRRLLEAGADVNAVDQWGQTALMRAAYNNHIKVIEALVGAGASVQTRNAAGKSALLYAAENAELETVQLLLSLGAAIDDADSTGATALMFACGRTEEKRGLVRLLLKRCTNARARDDKGMNALDYALGNGHEAIVAQLKSFGLEAADAAGLQANAARKKTELIRRVVCAACGAPKLRPYRSPYIYCDFCASFIDWDYRASLEISLQAASNAASPAYQNAMKELQQWSARMTQAIEHGDAAAYGEASARNIEAHYSVDPDHYSPRMADPDYRRRYLEYIQQSGDVMVRNLRVRELYESQARRNREVLFADGAAEPISFWKLFDAARQFREAYIEALAEAGVLDLHPDQPSVELTRKMAASTFLQGWAPYLQSADAERAIKASGLDGEYLMTRSVELESKHCGKCGASLATVPGARKALCEHCGTLLDAATPEYQCPSCRFAFTLTLSAQVTNCPACNTLLSRIWNPEAL